ncbi:15241_t:CDS:10 [Acaulospora morrowiae]|uniref:15241_t:CDS:1 n=1 Tax=Acaulospora morrowiae TaxID=94023 RepID=A0A9N8WV61_9GLOM|nr:15241_t:CDS:10 [Acaulospora morrowiae]
MSNSRVFNPLTLLNKGYRPVHSEAPNNEIEHEENDSEALIRKPETPPKDHYNIIYIICFIQGTSMLLGWNVFITADVFFRSRFAGSPYSDDFQNYFSLAYMSSNLLFLFHALYSQQTTSVSRRPIVALVISTSKFFLVATSTQYTELFTPSGYFYFIISLIFLDGITTAYLQNDILGLVSRFSPTHIQAVMSGYGLAGVAAALAQIFSSLKEEPLADNTLSEDALAKNAYIYFFSAFTISLTALISYLVLLRSSFYRHYVPIKNTTPRQPMITRPLLDTLKKVRVLAFAVTLVFVVTLGVFPSITSSIKSVVDEGNRKKFQKDYLFIPLHFLFYNLGDWLGRNLPTIDLLIITDQRKLAMLSIGRFVFIPIFLLCNVDVGLNGRRIFPLLIESDLLYFFFLSLFSVSNGYLTSLIMMAGPQIAYFTTAAHNSTEMDKKAQTKITSKLEKLHEFARKGGIGTCVATRDTLANTQVDLMFYTGEVITVLKHIKDDIYLGYCEGVIGRFRGSSVSFENNQLRTEKSDSLDEPTSEKKLRLDSPTTGHFLSPSDAERAIQMRSRSSSISSIELDSEKNTSSSSAPPSPVLTPAINITPSPIYDDVSINSSFPTLSKDSRHLHNKEFQNSSPSFNSNPDKTQTSQRDSPQTSNDQLKLSYQAQSDSPLSLNSRLAISSHSQNAFPSSKNQLRQMSSPFPSQNQSNQPISARRNNSAPPLINDDSTDPRSLSGNSGQNLTRPGQNFEPPISNDRIQSNDIDSQSLGRYPNAGGIVDSPTTSPNSSPRASRNLNDIPTTSGSDQHKVKSQASSLPSGPRQIHGRHRSASNDISSSARSLKYEESGRQRSSSSASSTLSRPPHLPTGNSHSNPSSAPHRVFGQSLLSPTRAEFQIVPPRRTSSIGLSSESSSSANSRPQVKINDRYSPSTTPSPSPISQTRANQFVVTNSPLSQNNGKNRDNFSTRKSAVLQPIVPSRVDVSDEPEDFVPSTPILVIESVDDSDVNDSENSSSEDDDEELVKSNDETRPQSKKEKVLAVDEYGFVHDVDEKEIPEGADGIQRIVTTPGSSKKDSRTIRLYREREIKWVHYLANMDPKVARESKKIKKLVRLGIPESVRGKSWQFMAGVHKYRKAGVYEELCKREKLPIYEVIERDIHRCYPDHIQFREETGFGQDDLHSILKAYAHYNKVVGYCQGMGRLVGMMLMQMPAEDTFWLLVATIEEYMVGYFTPTLSQVRIDSLVFEQLLFEHDPKLAQHLADSDVVPLMYMTQWFMTIFTMTLPWASVLRVWDVFYFEGVKFFHRVGLAILDCARDHILKNCPSSPEILGFLLHIPHELLTPDLLLEATFKIKLKRSTIEKMKRIAIEIENSNNSSGTDSPNPIHSVIKDKEARKAMMKKAKSSDKLKIDGIEFKMVNENNNP